MRSSEQERAFVRAAAIEAVITSLVVVLREKRVLDYALLERLAAGLSATLSDVDMADDLKQLWKGAVNRMLVPTDDGSPHPPNLRLILGGMGD